MAVCEKIGINVLRRASGGGAVYHDYGNLNYSLIIHKSSLKFNIDNIEASYNVFCGAVIEGLKLLGIDAYNRGGDIIIHGKKVSGSAQHRLYDVVLHHGTLMIDVNFDVLGRALGLKDPEKYLINLGNVLSDKVSLKKIKDAVNKGFEKRFDMQLMKSVLTAREKQIAEKLWKRKYSKRDWNIKKKTFIS
jgi:lipoate-protein ligase A